MPFPRLLRPLLSGLIFALLLAGCRPAAPSPAPALPMLPATSPPIRFTETSSPDASAITPEPRWQLYERALAKTIMTSMPGICEWDILGTSQNEVYVWAICRGTTFPTYISVPAVVYLNDQKEIVRVAIPRDGVYYGEDIEALFPKDVQEMINTGKNFDFDMKYAEKHLELRASVPSIPPLIAGPANPLP